MIIYTLLDTRYLIPDSTIREIQNDEALLNLIMRNWVNLDSMYSILKNVFQQKKPEYGGFFGDQDVNNIEFLKIMKEKMLDSTVDRLGVKEVSEEKILREMEIIKKQLELSSNYFVFYALMNIYSLLISM